MRSAGPYGALSSAADHHEVEEAAARGPPPPDRVGRRRVRAILETTVRDLEGMVVVVTAERLRAGMGKKTKSWQCPPFCPPRLVGSIST